jgi:sigma-B regulation protein RsbU (phosphoserine phosphatase)
MYMTMLVGLVDPFSRRFEFASAGHHMPLLMRGGRCLNLPVAASNIPLGIRHGRTFGLEDPLQLEPRDLLVLFTDGIWEATDDHGRRFGNAGLEAVLVANRDRSEVGIVDAIFRAVASHRADPEPDDDCTLVVLRCVR